MHPKSQSPLNDSPPSPHPPQIHRFHLVFWPRLNAKLVQHWVDMDMSSWWQPESAEPRPCCHPPWPFRPVSVDVLLMFVDVCAGSHPTKVCIHEGPLRAFRPSPIMPALVLVRRRRWGLIRACREAEDLLMWHQNAVWIPIGQMSLRKRAVLTLCKSQL